MVDKVAWGINMSNEYMHDIWVYDKVKIELNVLHFGTVKLSHILASYCIYNNYFSNNFDVNMYIVYLGEVLFMHVYTYAYILD